MEILQCEAVAPVHEETVARAGHYSWENDRIRMNAAGKTSKQKHWK